MEKIDITTLIQIRVRQDKLREIENKLSSMRRKWRGVTSIETDLDYVLLTRKQIVLQQELKDLGYTTPK